MNEITSSPYFGIVLSIFAFEVGIKINKKLKTPLANPLLIAILLVIAVLQVFRIPVANYNQGGAIITMFLAPATAALGISIYSQLELLKKNWLPIVVGTAVGAAVSMISVFVLCKIFKLDEVLIASLLPKSVTTPIAIEVSSQLGGLVPVTVAAVIITGIAGAIFAPLMIKIFHVKEPIAAGVAIGACSHAMGTTKALELGQVQGAMSGIAIGITGVMTVVYALFLS
ncbi:LrgB family protein [Cellulosilyticum ruminicola]|uniref:LrgB family protein n=1 Tax=Cellulosilyticum ruminicola TaxID=425254 RepID=UPI0006D1EF86|nr:LrgB family protein [Cellulosilyticum ruminicola]